MIHLHTKQFLKFKGQSVDKSDWKQTTDEQANRYATDCFTFLANVVSNEDMELIAWQASVRTPYRQPYTTFYYLVRKMAAPGNACHRIDCSLYNSRSKVNALSHNNDNFKK